MRMMSPVIGIKNPAPLAISISRTVTTKSFGLPSSSGLSLNDFCVFAMQTGKPESPKSSIFFKSFFAFPKKSIAEAP